MCSLAFVKALCPVPEQEQAASAVEDMMARRGVGFPKLGIKLRRPRCLSAGAEPSYESGSRSGESGRRMVKMTKEQKRRRRRRCEII